MHLIMVPHGHRCRPRCPAGGTPTVNAPLAWKGTGDGGEGGLKHGLGRATADGGRSMEAGAQDDEAKADTTGAATPDGGSAASPITSHRPLMSPETSRAIDQWVAEQLLQPWPLSSTQIELIKRTLRSVETSDCVAAFGTADHPLRSAGSEGRSGGGTDQCRGAARSRSRASSRPGA